MEGLLSTGPTPSSFYTATHIEMHMEKATVCRLLLFIVFLYYLYFVKPEEDILNIRLLPGVHNSFLAELLALRKTSEIFHFAVTRVPPVQQFVVLGAQHCILKTSLT